MSEHKPQMVAKVGITDLTLRDAHQSLFATRMKTEDMLPIAEAMDEIGYHSLEVWGGATFDSCMRFLNEDPWERLRELRKRFKKTKLQMLLRGQNLVGYKNYADDVVEEFVKRAVGNGVDIMRIFDALNDVRNMDKAMRVSKAAGAHVQGTISYTTSPVHDVEYYVKTSKLLAEMGSDSICLKDMAGILSPVTAYEIVSRLKAEVGLPVQVHCHYTSGMASMTYLKAIEAGADILDCNISSMAMGTGHPATETMVATLAEMPCDTGLDLRKLKVIADYFKEVRKKYAEFDVGTVIDAGVLIWQIPGGMLSNFVSQLAKQNASHRLEEVLDEVPRVRKDLGYPPLVTPTSQIVGSQAVLNVLAGRYKMVTNEVKNYLRGQYGLPPAPVNEELRKQIIGDEEVITVRPADVIPPGLPEAAQQAAPYMEKPEDILSVAIFPQVALPFLQERQAKRTGVDYALLEQSKKQGSSYAPV
jgi:oxaloacetate decarboxylase alpha subunit